MRTILVLTLKSVGIRIRLRNIFQFGKGDSIQTVGHVERTLTHLCQLQIGPYCILVEVELGLLGLLKVVAPVPAFGFEVASLLPNSSLDIGQLLLRFGNSWCPDLIQQFIDILLVLRHVAIQHIAGIIGEAHDLGLLQTGGYQLFDHLLIIVGISVVTPADVALEDLFAQGPVVGILQEGHHTRIVQCEDPLPLLAR